MSSTRRAPVIITLATALLFLVVTIAISGVVTPRTDSTAQAAVADQFERFFGFRMELTPGPPSDRVWRGFQGGGFTVIPVETNR